MTDFSAFWSEFTESYGERTEDTYDCESGEHTGRGGFFIAPSGDYVYPTEAGTIGGIVFGAPAGPSPLNASCGKFQPSNKTAAELNAEFSFVPGMDFYTTVEVGGEQKEWQRYTILDSDTTGFALSDNELKLKYSGTAELHYFYYEGDGSVSGENTITYSWDYSLVITLSGEATYASVLDDAIGLLGEFPLNNDAIYPWRTDGKTWLQPLITRDAAATEPTINWGVDEDCEFLDEIYYTGAIRGAPLPAGYGRHFDFHHTVWGKTNNGLGICAGCELFLGELSADPVPIGATAWTDRMQGSSTYGPGAHVTQVLDASYSSGSPGLSPIQGVMMQKWAETFEAWPSVNFARTCGHDRYLRDETHVACITDFTEPDLIIASDPMVEFEVGDIVGLPEGIYQVTGKTDAFNYSLTKVGDLPDSIEYDGVAKLRFPDARAICGILPVTAAQDGGYVSITVPEAHWLRTGDIVDFKNVAGLGAGETVTVTGEKTFKVVGVLDDYDGLGYVVSAGVTSELWNWHNTCPRHEFLLREWKSQYREAHEDPETPGNIFSESSHDLAPLAGHPSVLVISPNSGDTFTNMYKQTWDNGIISADHCFGQEWHMDFLQAVVDPFWQADHEPCGHSGAWSQAGTPCGEDSDHYQYPPLVEPRLTKPDGAPDIPVTLYYGGSAMPQGVGTPPCGAGNMHLPNEKAPIHAIRLAWETCDDWKIRVNAKCPGTDVDI